MRIVVSKKKRAASDRKKVLHVCTTSLFLPPVGGTGCFFKVSGETKGKIGAG